MKLAGYWRIAEMELWDAEAIDLVAPAFIEFAGKSKGGFSSTTAMTRDSAPCAPSLSPAYFH